MDEQTLGWIMDAYDRLWLRSEDFTAERHGLTVLTCFPASRSGQVIVVRDEYLRLWDLLRDAHNRKHFEGLMLTGHTGTGKSWSILYAFLRALKERIPVAFCTSPSEYYYCDETGCTLYPTTPSVWHDMPPGKFFLALVDYGESTAIPPYNFLDRSQMCYTVQVTSPQSARWGCGWTKRRDAWYWIMSLWTEVEVRKLQYFYEQEGPHPWKNNDAYYSPLETFALLGPSIRKCFCTDGNRRTAQGPAHDFEAFLRPDYIFDNVDDFVAALRTGTVTSPRPDLDFHRLFVLSRCYGRSNPMPHRASFHHAVPTLFLVRLLSAHFLRRTPAEQVALITKISKVPNFEALSFMYEPAILDILCAPLPLPEGPPATCHLADGSATSFTLGPGLVLAPDEITWNADADMNTARIVPRDNHLYLLRSGSGFPWLNAFVLSEGMTRVTLLQTTVSYRREAVSSTVRRVVALVRRSLPNTPRAAIRWSLVFVSPGSRGEQLAKALGKVEFRGRRCPIVVAGWMEVGARLGYSEEVLDALKREDAEVLFEEIDDDDDDDGGDDGDGAERHTELEEGPRVRRHTYLERL